VRGYIAKSPNTPNRRRIRVLDGREALGEGRAVGAIFSQRTQKPSWTGKRPEQARRVGR
jgi:hypothetical protein